MEFISESAKKTQGDAQKNVLTFSEALAYTGLSRSYMYKLTAGRGIPHYKPHGKLLYFNRAELDNWML